MTPEVRTITPLAVTLTGMAVRHDPARTYGQDFKIAMDRMWAAIKAGGGVKNKGITWAVYGPGDRVFAGVEVLQPLPDPSAMGLEVIDLRLDRYAWIKHIGPYQLLGNAYTTLNKFIIDQGLKGDFPQVEIYGHGNNDDSKLETEVLITVR